jgi:hypothetical protein
MRKVHSVGFTKQLPFCCHLLATANCLLPTAYYLLPVFPMLFAAHRCLHAADLSGNGKAHAKHTNKTFVSSVSVHVEAQIYMVPVRSHHDPRTRECVDR